MSTDRYVVIGLAHVRSTWFTEVARWATSGSIPVEFVKCLSTEELRARVASGRPFSAALLDGRLPSVDRDLIATLADARIPSLVVAADGAPTDWTQLGAATALGFELSRVDLIEALVDHARPVGPVDNGLIDGRGSPLPPAWLGRLVVVTGRSGSGASTVSAALAQALATDPRYGNSVVLADLARHAHQALLHDARDVVPGVQELVEAHRNGHPTMSQLRELLFAVPSRGYHLLLGLRRPADWITVRSQAFTAALDGLRSTARVVVADVDHDIEGEATTGSLDIEDRNLMARHACAEADLVCVVTTPTVPGIHGLVCQLDALRNHGVPGNRLLVVVNRAPRGARYRSELTSSIAVLTGSAERSDPHVGPVFLTDRRSMENTHRDLARFPAAFTGPLAHGVTEVLEREGRRNVGAGEPMAIVPGSLGRWADEEEASS